MYLLSCNTINYLSSVDIENRDNYIVNSQLKIKYERIWLSNVASFFMGQEKSRNV